MAYSKEQKDTAALLWRLGANAQEIALELGLNSRWVVYKWVEDEKWDKALSTTALIVKTARRVNWLIEKAEKSEADYRELHQLGELLIKEEKAEAYRRGTTETNGFSRAGRKPDQRTGEGKTRQKKQKNDVSALSAEQLQALEEKLLYPHQLIWIKAGEDPATYRQRFILKSRQIGATYTFAWEAFKNAVLKGHNQIFISSTKAQAEVFKAYIFLIAKEHFEIELTGNPTKLSNGAEICYLSPNSNANSRSGDVYFDEVFYTRQFDKMEAIAKPMGTLQQYKHTYFGAPTAISHPAYTIWSGERFTKYHPETQIEVSKHADLFYGRKDPDGFWRCVTTVDSAIEMGWDQVSLEHASLAVLSLPQAYHEKFRLVAKQRFRGLVAGQQAQRVVGLCRQFKIEYMDIDKTGPGLFIPDIVLDALVQAELDIPRIVATQYSDESKTRLVQKGLNVIAQRRFEYDENDHDLPLAFMTIHQSSTPSGNSLTYYSVRTNTTGHGDEAWAVLHAMQAEGVTSRSIGNAERGSRVVFAD